MSNFNLKDMSEREKQAILTECLENVLTQFRLEYDISHISIIGALDILKLNTHVNMLISARNDTDEDENA